MVVIGPTLLLPLIECLNITSPKVPPPTEELGHKVSMIITCRLKSPEKHAIKSLVTLCLSTEIEVQMNGVVNCFYSSTVSKPLRD